jgi:hypothetical protein
MLHLEPALQPQNCGRDLEEAWQQVKASREHTKPVHLSCHINTGWGAYSSQGPLGRLPTQVQAFCRGRNSRCTLHRTVTWCQGASFFSLPHALAAHILLGIMHHLVLLLVYPLW